MSGLLRRVQAFADREGLWTPGTRVVAAVSGGSDSVALTWLLHQLAAEGRLRLAGLAHLHHHLRGADADADAAFVGDLAARLGVPVQVGHADVAALARDGRRSVELAGRDARLAFFEQAREALAGDVVAVAHTRGDQAETVLFRLTRGSGPRGLAGMAPRNGIRIRPLLEVGRAELQAWLVGLGEGWREDASNAVVGPSRNRLRHRVLPELAALNPRVEEALARAARIQAADARLLDRLAAEAAASVVAVEDGRTRLDSVELARLPDALARRVILRALETLDPSRAYGWEEADGVLRVPAAGRTRVGRIGVERKPGEVVLIKRGPPSPSAEAGPPLTVDVPGRVSHPRLGWTLDITGPMAPCEAPPPGVDCAVLDATALGRHLTIRGWRPGDRVQPLGLAGRKKVHDVFVDRKVPRDSRALVPLIVDRLGRIAWVAGHVVGEAFRVTPHSSGVVVLTLRR